MIFDHENGYVKQIIIYLENSNYEEAHKLSEEFVSQFPKSLMSHYLLAKSYYWVKNFPAALMEGHKAFNLAESEDDLIATAIFLACVLYELKRYTRAVEILKMVEQFDNEKVEKALFILSLCTNQPEVAMLHVDTLYKINREVANDFVDRFLKYARTIESHQPPSFAF